MCWHWNGASQASCLHRLLHIVADDCNQGNKRQSGLRKPPLTADTQDATASSPDQPYDQPNHGSDRTVAVGSARHSTQFRENCSRAGCALAGAYYVLESSTACILRVHSLRQMVDDR